MARRKAGQRVVLDDTGGLEDEDIIVFGKEEIEESLQICAKSLIGRILADRSFGVGTVEGAMRTIWSHPKGFKVMDLGDNLFQFFFEKEVDLVRVERGAPWLLKNYIVNIKRWEEKDINNNDELSQVPIWVQLWGIPEHYKSKELRRKIGGTMGEVVEVDFYSMRGRESRILKVKIFMDATKPLRRSLRIARPNRNVIELSVKYERIGTFCNYCGHLGHESRGYNQHLEDSIKGEVQEEKWGNWLKAKQVGWRVESYKENANPNIPKVEISRIEGPKKQTPVNLLRSFANPSMQENSGENEQVESKSKENNSGNGACEKIMADQRERLLLVHKKCGDKEDFNDGRTESEANEEKRKGGLKGVEEAVSSDFNIG
ncbi:uncharacterized protein [Arachis hypogaea]|uniref:uncharacterized protein n=1 Tax=Arachis hypogaea TaxID=3818 RepID=UPI000DED0E4B|nr:uncharacterized protein LOC112729931 [Arachis hypogaea]XP_025636567.1 uncharacterized protein LOC112730721 [Arachis hypogaea]